MSSPRLHQNAVSFLGFLTRYRDDRGALAALRGGLSDARRPRAWPLLGGFPGAIGNPAYETVAALWGYAPDSHRPDAGNLGAALHQLAGDLSTFEGRLKRLLTCATSEEAAAHVAPVVRAAQVKGVQIDYVRLLSDLLWWGDGVKVEWAKAFWGAPAGEGSVANAALLDTAPAAAGEGTP